MLNAAELALLSHYITHTSRILSFDKDDLYALEVGIPNLAFNNKPLMASLLALAAVSKCCHISKHSSAPLESFNEICELLVLADQHHRISLQQLQAAIPSTDRYEYVMLNAIFMAEYGSVRHCVRICLAKAATLSGKQLPSELLPTGSHWISLTRAAHLAHFGLGASRLLLPIVAATSFPALEKLHASAQSTRMTGVHDSELQACFASMEILRDVFATVFPIQDSVSRSPPKAVLGHELPLPGALSGAPSWLASYLARITSGAPSSPIRRTDMGFVNRMPVEPGYDRLVPCEMVDSESLPPSTAGQLAMDIFAHWLVLVMALDDVWWIGGMGEWELGPAVSFMQAQGWADFSTVSRETWWLESMHRVAKSLHNV
ncbi:hypothetical protein B0J13DRAFT_640861 [Dactylonectria estremocensis]|uniref:Transcription factor domain-containing protein n=1 Tax=Dactylonectria estremocensis TaxID=1079267 RepID=A0A9P9IUY6_9HYPO|nr:hypothetical protein B0J13DRAFT_640861 [Dactylonectria estremocensis]